MTSEQASLLQPGQRLKALKKVSTINAGEQVYFISYINGSSFPLFSMVENRIGVKYSVDLTYFECPPPLSAWDKFVEAVKTFFS